MNPFLYVQEEFANVKRALDDSLRHDYGPGQTEGYYNECLRRLEHIKPRLSRLEHEQDPVLQREKISSVLDELSDLANRLALIERSRLGEFSWPFSQVVRRIAKGVLADEPDLFDEAVSPIIHVIAEGTGYQIRTEQVLGPSGKRRLVTVAFPRQLKHHVLMHSIFGHEIGHAAFFSTGSKPICKGKVVPGLRALGPLHTPNTVMDWLRDDDAPKHIRGRFPVGCNPIARQNLDHWILELICDLFGLMIFGPSFVAAHRALLEPAARDPYRVDVEPSTHPSFAVRRRMLVRAMHIRGWNVPQCSKEDGATFYGEKAFLEYACEDNFSRWCSVFTDEQIDQAMKDLEEVFDTHPQLLATVPDREGVLQLVGRLGSRIPPLRETIDEEGVATYEPMPADHCLYAGWAYWFGRDSIHAIEPLDFFDVNRLCDLALLQQEAIGRVQNWKPAE